MSFNYSAWLDRLQAFVERIHGMPGHVYMQNVRQQVSSESLLELAEKLPVKVPGPLLEFYAQGASDYKCTYLGNHPRS